jgi:hypothetical protein
LPLLVFSSQNKKLILSGTSRSAVVGITASNSAVVGIILTKQKCKSYPGTPLLCLRPTAEASAIKKVTNRERFTAYLLLSGIH